jgi:hypothetical protein
VFRRLAAADRAHQREVGGRFLFRGVKFLLAFVGLCFLLDLFLHLGAGTRLALVLALVLGALALACWSWYLAWVRRNQLAHIARFLESREPALGSKLINFLQLDEQARAASLAPLTRELAALAVSGYAEQLAPVNLERLARTPQLRLEVKRAAWATLAFAVVLGVFFRVTSTEVPRFVDPFGDHPPYSLTRLEILEPGESGTNVIYGRSFLVKVKVAGHQPKELFLTAHPPDHPEQAITLPMFDKGSVGFHQQLENIRSDLLVAAHTRDRRSVSRQARIDVILVPQLEKAFVQVTPPAYTGLKAEEKPYTFQGVQALAGSEMRFRLKSNRPLREGTLEVLAGELAPQLVPLTRSGDSEVSGHFTARDSGRLRFRIVDTEGIPSEATWEGGLTVTHDLAPEIAVAEPAKDCFVALDFKVEARVDASDDYGLKTLRLHRGLNGVYSAPRLVTFSNVVRQARESVLFDFAELGVQPGDVVSLFAEAMDTAPDPHLARSQTVNLNVISVEDYNAFLLERSDISDLLGKYEELISQLHDLIEEQRKLSEGAEKLKHQLAQAGRKSDDAAARELDALLARQSEVNQKLDQQAERMENFVRPDPLYDVEKELQQALRRQAAALRESTATNSAAARDIAQRSTPTPSQRQVGLELAGDFKQASDEQLARLGGAEEAMQRDITGPLQDLSLMQELQKDFKQFEALYQAQQAVAEQTRAYNRAGTLNREDQLALKSLAATEQQIGDMMKALEKKLRDDARAAEKLFPKAAQSGMDLAEAMEQARLQPLARQATATMLAGQGDRSYAGAERLRSEMEKLFSECKSGNCPGGDEVDNYLRLTRGMNPGRNFAQMARSRKFGRVPGQGQSPQGQGEGEAGDTGYAVTNGDTLDVLGNESFIARSDATAKSSAQPGLGKGKPEDGASQLVLDKSDVVKGLNPVNRQSGAVAAESVIEEYRDVVENYFKTITKGGGR